MGELIAAIASDWLGLYWAGKLNSLNVSIIHTLTEKCIDSHAQFLASVFFSGKVRVCPAVALF